MKQKKSFSFNLSLKKLINVTSLTLKAPTPQNGKTGSNNSLATAEELFECV